MGEKVEYIPAPPAMEMECQRRFLQLQIDIERQIIALCRIPPHLLSNNKYETATEVALDSARFRGQEDDD